MNPSDFDQWMRVELDTVERALQRWVPPGAPARLGDAMRYAVLDGGKRLRPLLVLAASEAVGGNDAAALRAACATELIHAYSLVHDDLPCMDNDVLRRGKPTVHVKFGEADALLAGDALQALAFELLTPEGDEIPASIQATLCRLLARAAGSQGMAGGQAIDLAAVKQTLNEAALERMHRQKTGALIQASVLLGALSAGLADAAERAALAEFGAEIGLAFQIQDDILDVEGNTSTLGKRAGADANLDKPTYPSVLGLEAARGQAIARRDRAIAALAPWGSRYAILGEFEIGRAHV